MTTNILHVTIIFIRSMILASFVMILGQYNFLTTTRFPWLQRLLVLDSKSELLVMIVARRYNIIDLSLFLKRKKEKKGEKKRKEKKKLFSPVLALFFLLLNDELC